MPETPKLPTFLNKKRRNEEHSSSPEETRNIQTSTGETFFWLTSSWNTASKGTQTRGIIDQTHKTKANSLQPRHLIFNFTWKNAVRGVCALRCVFTLSVAVRVPLNKRESFLIQNFLKGKVFVDWNSEVCRCLWWKQFFSADFVLHSSLLNEKFLRFHCVRLGDSEIGNRKRSALISIHLSSDEGLIGLPCEKISRRDLEIYVKMSSLSVWLAFNNERSLLWPELSTANCNSRA